MKNLEIRTFEKTLETSDKIIPFLKIDHTISKLRNEHPSLAILYDDLNNCIKLKHNLGRSRDMVRHYENEEATIRRQIKEYERSHNITREDHLRWNT